jgi:hypothetical protein
LLFSWTSLRNDLLSILFICHDIESKPPAMVATAQNFELPEE